MVSSQAYGSGTIRRCGLIGRGVALLEVCHCGGRALGVSYMCSSLASVIQTLLLAACRRYSSPGCPWIKIQNSWLFQYHVSLDAAMIPTMMIMD
jgi:predicted metal-binding protein